MSAVNGRDIGDLTPPIPDGVKAGPGIAPVTVGRIERRALQQDHPIPLAGMSLFTLAPVYVGAVVSRDLVADFCAETEPVEILNIHYERRILSGCIGEDWSSVVQAIPDAVYPYLERYVCGVGLIDSAKRAVWRIRHETAVVCGVILHVFLPSSSICRYTMISVGLADGTSPCAGIPIVRSAPGPDDIAEAEKYFS